MKSKQSLSPSWSAVHGSLFALPFIVANFIVVFRLEPFLSVLRFVGLISSAPVIPLLLLLLFPVGAFVAIKPMLQKSKGKQKFYLLNGIIAAVLLIVFVLLFTALAQEMYQCEVLQVVNCD